MLKSCSTCSIKGIFYDLMDEKSKQNWNRNTNQDSYWDLHCQWQPGQSICLGYWHIWQSLALCPCSLKEPWLPSQHNKYHDHPLSRCLLHPCSQVDVPKMQKVTSSAFYKHKCLLKISIFVIKISNLNQNDKKATFLVKWILYVYNSQTENSNRTTETTTILIN